jgi:predicted membrane protein
MENRKDKYTPNETKQSIRRYYKLNIATVGLLCIAVGVLLLLRNFGIMSNQLFHLLVSWELLLIVLGLVWLVKQRLTVGFILLAFGLYFFIPDVFGLSDEWKDNMWPFFLVLLGLILLLKLRKQSKWTKYDEGWRHNPEGATVVEDGFVTADVSFGSVHHIVLDPEFKGAFLRVSFGSAVLDLRHTQLIGEETSVTIDASFGGIELYAPSAWNVISELNTNFSGVDDKRYLNTAIDSTHKLVIRGNIIFGGVEIKN